MLGEADVFCGRSCHCLETVLLVLILLWSTLEAAIFGDLVIVVVPVLTKFYEIFALKSTNHLNVLVIMSNEGVLSSLSFRHSFSMGSPLTRIRS